jgi:methionyl-tRNA formyltransferase
VRRPRPVHLRRLAGELGRVGGAILVLRRRLRQPQLQQREDRATYAPKLTRETAEVDWTRPAHEVGSHVRAYDPKPGAWGRVNGAEVKLFGARVAPKGSRREPGEVIAIEVEGMLVACGGGAVRITAVQPAGKRRLSPQDWSNGRGVAIGDRFDTSAAAPA